MGVGHSRAPDAAVAGAQAAEEALQGRGAALLVVFCAASYDVGALVEAVHRSAGAKVALIGCTTAGELSSAGSSQGGAVVAALGGEGLGCTVGSAPSVQRQRAAGREVAACVGQLGQRWPHRVLVMLSDGLVGSQGDVMRGAYAALGATVPVVGGCAADSQRRERTYQFVGDDNGVRVLSGSVVAAAIGSDAPMGIGCSHGWHKYGEPMVVTDSNGLAVRSIDDQPALDVFLRCFDGDPAVADDLLALRQFARRHPLGLSRRATEAIRVIHGADVAERSLHVLEDIPQGSLVWRMRSTTESLVAGVALSYEEALTALDGRQPRGMLVFDCAVRRHVLGPEGIEQELATMAATAGEVPFAGFYTFGEFARVAGSSGMKVLSVVTLLFA